jgi:hypothetical protein
MKLSARVRRLVAPALAVPLLAGCDLPGLPAGLDPAGGESASGQGDSWVVVAEGRPTPSPTRPAPAPTKTPAALLGKPTEADPYCAFARSAGQIIIPLTVVSGSSSATISWPRTGDPPPATYRIAAVPQRLVSGEQPHIEWRTVTAGPGCKVTMTINGLITGEPYVFWLDAPDSGHQPDGTPRPTHGRSSVIYAG